MIYPTTQDYICEEVSAFLLLALKSNNVQLALGAAELILKYGWVK